MTDIIECVAKAMHADWELRKEGEQWGGPRCSKVLMDNYRQKARVAIAEVAKWLDEVEGGLEYLVANAGDALRKELEAK